MSDRTCSCSAYMAGECICGAWAEDEQEEREASIQAATAALTAERDQLRAIAADAVDWLGADVSKTVRRFHAARIRHELGVKP